MAGGRRTQSTLRFTKEKMDWKRFEGSGNKGEGEKGKTLTTKDTTLTVRGQARLAEALRGSECPKIPSKNPTPKIHLKTMGPKKSTGQAGRWRLDGASYPHELDMADAGSAEGGRLG